MPGCERVFFFFFFFERVCCFGLFFFCAKGCSCFGLFVCFCGKGVLFLLFLVRFFLGLGVVLGWVFGGFHLGLFGCWDELISPFFAQRFYLGGLLDRFMVLVGAKCRANVG